MKYTTLSNNTKMTGNYYAAGLSGTTHCTLYWQQQITRIQPRVAANQSRVRGSADQSQAGKWAGACAQWTKLGVWPTDHGQTSGWKLSNKCNVRLKFEIRLALDRVKPWLTHEDCVPVVPKRSWFGLSTLELVLIYLYTYLSCMGLGRDRRGIGTWTCSRQFLIRPEFFVL